MASLFLSLSLMKNGGLLVLVWLAFGCSSPADYKPDHYLDPMEKDRMVATIVRYTGKLPKKVEDSLKFDRRHDQYYQKLASKHKMLRYHVSKNGEHYFLIRRPAPSLYEKYV